MIVTTDDGSFGRKDLQTEPVEEILREKKIKLVHMHAT